MVTSETTLHALQLCIVRVLPAIANEKAKSAVISRQQTLETLGVETAAMLSVRAVEDSAMTNEGLREEDRTKEKRRQAVEAGASNRAQQIMVRLDDLHTAEVWPSTLNTNPPLESRRGADELTNPTRLTGGRTYRGNDRQLLRQCHISRYRSDRVTRRCAWQHSDDSVSRHAFYAATLAWAAKSEL